jgi:hypothetical protein
MANLGVWDMAIFKVENVKTWYVFGDYEATDEKHALDVYAQDAGYRDFAHICEEVPVEEGEIVATLKREADISEIYQTVIDGLNDNARVNDVPVSEGWHPDLAIETYAAAASEELTKDDYTRLQSMVDKFLDENSGVES